MSTSQASHPSFRYDIPNISRGYLTAAFELFGTVYSHGTTVDLCFSSQRKGEFFDKLSWLLFILGVKVRKHPSGSKLFIERNEDVDFIMELIDVNYLSDNKRSVYQRWEMTKEDSSNLTKEVFVSESGR